MVVGPLCGQGSMGRMECFIVCYRCLQDAVELWESWLHAEADRNRFVAFCGETLVWCLANEPHDGWNVVIATLVKKKKKKSCLPLSSTYFILLYRWCLCSTRCLWVFGNVWQCLGDLCHRLVSYRTCKDPALGVVIYIIVADVSVRLILELKWGTACISTEVSDTGIDFLMFAWSVSQEAGICKHPLHKRWPKSLESGLPELVMRIKLQSKLSH